MSFPFLLPPQRGMSISSISSDDMEFLDFEANQSQDGGGPKGPRSGSPFSMVEDPAPISNTSSQHVGRDKKPTIPSIAVDSFLPLLNTLPALVLDGNTYHLRGAISKSDLQNLSAYVQTIGEFTLNSNSTGEGQHSIDPGAFMRLAQLKIRDAPGPLLPTLKQLRVVEPNESSISQLSLFFTKSLQSLEATGVPEAQQSAFLSFLITLVDEAPLLSAITIGPGSFTASCLNACLKFDHLRNLELIDAASSIDFDFLVAIGGLPELEIFILNARTATYISPPVDILNPDELSNPASRSPSPKADLVFPDSRLEPPVLGFVPSPDDPAPFGTPRRAPSPNPTPKLPAQQPCDSGPIDIQMQSGSPDRAAPAGRFVHLRQLDIIGSLPLIRDLYEDIISVDLERLGMTLVRTSAPTFHVVPADVPTKPRKGSKGTKKKVSAINAEVHTPTTTSSIDLETDSFFTLVENAVKEKWPLTLKGVRLGHLQDYRGEDSDSNCLCCRTYRDPDPIALPFTMFGVLLKHNVLEDLDIAGWTLPRTETKLPVDEILQATLPNLKKIHLPIGGPTHAIQLVQLLPIVRTFPRLVSLQCSIEQPGNFPVPPTPAADVPLHGLKVLSVGHQNLPGSAIDQKQQLGIANFLDILFPDLERIETHAGHHAEVWAHIYELIKMCQASRLYHANRLTCGPPLS